MSDDYPTPEELDLLRKSLRGLCAHCCAHYPPVPPLFHRREVVVTGEAPRSIPTIDAGKLSFTFVERLDVAFKAVSGEISKLTLVAARILQTAGDPAFEEDEFWRLHYITGFFLRPLIETYFRRNPTAVFCQDDAEAALVCWLDPLLKPQKRVRVVAPVVGLTSIQPGTTLLPDAPFRSATPAELQEWEGERRRGHDYYEVHGAKVVVEVSKQKAWEAVDHDDVEDMAEDALSALQLAVGGDIVAAFLQVLVDGQSRLPTSLGPGETNALWASRRAAVALDHEAAAQATQLWHRLRASPGRESIQFALRRLRTAASRFRAEDRLVDYWIALESLFADDAQTEVTYRASLRIAAFIGDTGDERVTLRAQLKKSYDLRCKIVHGSSKLRASDLKEQTQFTKAVLRRSVQRILDKPDRFSAARLDDELLRRG